MTQVKQGGTIELHVRNYKRARSLDITLKPGVNGIAGENGAGKSSGGVDALANLLGGKKLSPPDPINDEADDYKLEAALPDLGLLLTRTGERQKDGRILEEFKVTNLGGDQKGETRKRPQELLDTLMKGRGAELASIMEMSEKDRIALLYEIAGLDFTDLDELREKAYGDRKLAKSNANALRARIEAMPKAEGLPEKLISVSDLMSELDVITDGNKSNEGERQKLAAVENLRVAAVTQSERILEQLAHLQERADEQKMEVDRLVAEKATLEAVVDELKDTDDTDLRQRIANADSINEEIRLDNTRTTLMGELDIESEEAAKQDDLIKQIDESKLKKLSSADLPGDLSFVGEEIYLTSKPIEQASTVEQINASLDIAIARNPDLRLFAIRDGSLYDTKHRKTLHVAAKERNVIVVFEIVADSLEEAQKAEATVFMRDGIGTTVPALPKEDS